jgi:hypothetical protein
VHHGCWCHAFCKLARRHHGNVDAAQLLAKAAAKEKDRAKSDEKKARKAERAFMEYLMHDAKPLVRASDSWDEVRNRYCTELFVRYWPAWHRFRAANMCLCTQLFAKEIT